MKIEVAAEFYKELKALLEKYDATIGFHSGDEDFKVLFEDDHIVCDFLDYWVDASDL
jgi:hypothetical protein